MNPIGEFFSLITSPFGAAIMTLCGVVYLYALQKNLGKWLLLGSLIFVASLSRYINEWVTNPPPFWGPLNVLVGAGRPITVLLVVFSILIAAGSIHRTKFPPALLGLIACHFVIALKTFLQGSISFALMVIVFELLIFVLYWRISNFWISNEAAIENAFVAIFFAALLFVGVNAFQFVVDSSPQIVAHGRFNGSTGNPQHAAAFLGCAVPASIYVFFGYKNRVVRLLALATLVAVLYFLSLTGSRTGLVLAAVSILLIARRQSASSTIVIAGVAALAGLFFVTNDTALEKILEFEDTRSHVWASMWRSFLSSPVFGSQLVSDRLGFGENSWLAIASATGLVGLLPLAVFGFLSFGMSLKLITAKGLNKKAKLQCDALGATIICLLVGSVFEAYLLSGLTAPCLIAGIVTLAGYKQLKFHEIRRKRIGRARRGRLVSRPV